jgi:hypothetical protein
MWCNKSDCAADKNKTLPAGQGFVCFGKRPAGTAVERGGNNRPLTAAGEKR